MPRMKGSRWASLFLVATAGATLAAAQAPVVGDAGSSDATPSASDARAPEAEAPPPTTAPSATPDSAAPSPALLAKDASAPLLDSPVLHSAFVHLHADYPGAVLELRNYVDDTDWKEACRAPCDRTLRVDGMDARVLAPGMTTSNVFRIDAGRGTANLKVVGGSARSRTIGTVALASGIPVALGGMALWGYGKIDDRAGLRTAGLVTMGVAAVMVLGSLPFLGAGSTKVRDGKGKVIALPRSSDYRPF